MPPAKAANPARRAGPAFKPQRPVKAPTQTAKLSTSSIRAPKTSTSASKKPTASRTHFRSTLNSISPPSSEDEEQAQEEEEDEEMDDLDDPDDKRIPSRASPSTAAAVAPPLSQEIERSAIPPALLARLLYEGFEDKGMKIQREAMEVTGKYMETFVREALARARFERNDAGHGGEIEDGFLQVEDLEKLAPQLLLDF